uniref:Uncharacterized protein n=1 Tax=Anguilla anguilla TaxID=7936 RepID=A0A0E9U153_ANGAN
MIPEKQKTGYCLSMCTTTDA